MDGLFHRENGGWIAGGAETHDGGLLQNQVNGRPPERFVLEVRLGRAGCDLQLWALKDNKPEQVTRSVIAAGV